MNNIIQKIRRSGMTETTWAVSSILIQKIASFLRISMWRSRGYLIHPSVFLGRNIVFFQGKKHMLRVGKHVFIGDGVRIKAGFDGSVMIGDNVYIHDYSCIFAQKKLSIGDNTLISPQVFITDFNHRYTKVGIHEALDTEQGYVSSQVAIGKNVWIGAHAVILPGVTIGDGVVIGAGSVVTKSVPPYSVAVGNPARVIKKIKA